jgi:hypothetical protein
MIWWGWIAPVLHVRPTLYGWLRSPAVESEDIIEPLRDVCLYPRYYHTSQ